MSAVVAASPVSPFKGLAAFDDSELDALFFFGRERERKLVVANVLASRLTVLYGASGVGKSSLLRAAVLPDLRESAPAAAVAFRAMWSGELGDLRTEFSTGGEGFLILDQFEEYFLYHADDGSGPIVDQLSDLLASTDVNVLIALREDALARLSAFKARIPSIFANQFRLKHLEVEQARRAVLGPLRRWEQVTGEHVDAEPSFVEAIVDDAAVDGGRVEAPFLQLVLERVWEAERAARSWLLRRETLDGLGGAAAIVRDQFRGALDALPPEEQDTAVAVFEHLVTPTGTKVALGTGDLAVYASVPTVALERVLERLTRERVVRAVDGSDRYEIFHDVLAEPIAEWRVECRLARERAAARRRQRRLALVAAASLVALALVAALALWAFSERGTARDQARRAHAHELLARAAAALQVDPRASVADAVAAARIEPGAATQALRDALIADRLRTTLHFGVPVESVAAALHGTMFAAVAGPNRIVVGDAETGRIVRTLHGSYAWVGFTRNGRVVGVSGPGTTADGLAAARTHAGSLVLVPDRGALAHALRHASVVRATPDGSLVVAAVESPDGRTRALLFDRRGRLLHVLPEIGIHGVDISPDGRTVVTASASGDATIWSSRNGKRVRTFTDDVRSYDDVAFSPDGTLLATSSSDGVVRIWTVADGSRLFYFTGQASPDGTLAWSPDGRMIASANRDRTIRLWAVRGLVETGSTVATLTGAGDAVHSLAFTADGRRLVAASDDGTVRIWDSSPDQHLRVVTRFATPVVGASFAGHAVVAAAADGTARVVDSRTGRVLRTLQLTPTTAALALSADGTVAAVGSSVFDVRSGRLLVSHPETSATAVAVNPTGTLAVAAAADGTIRAWHVASGSEMWTARGRSRVNDIRFSPDGLLVAVADATGVTLRSAGNGHALHVLHVPGGVVRLVFSADGRLLASADNDFTARVWFVASGHPYRILRGHRAALTDVGFSHDGALLVTAAHDAEARIWNIDRGRLVHVLRGHFGEVGSVTFSPDRRWVVTGGPISAGLWPMSTGRLFFYLRGDAGLLTTVSFSPDGRTILSGSVDGTVRTYRCDVCGRLDELVARAKRLLATSR